GDAVFDLVGFQYFGESRVRIPGVQKQRFLNVKRELDLRLEPFFLVGMRRIVAIEVEAAFADRDHARMLRELAQPRNGLLIALPRVMRMHADGRVEIRARRCDGNGLIALRDRSPGDDDRAHPRSGRPREHFREVLAEGGMTKICTDINELHRAAEYTRAPCRAPTPRSKSRPGRKSRCPCTCGRAARGP